VDFGSGRVTEDPANGMLTVMEKISDKDGEIVSSIIAEPSAVKEFTQVGKDRLVIIPVKSGEPVTYYVGAGWSKDPRFDPFEYKWGQYMIGVSYESLRGIYK
jgi:hypothetical protein